MIRVLAPVAILALAACADREMKAASSAPANPAEVSATSPLTVNPEPKASASAAERRAQLPYEASSQPTPAPPPGNEEDKTMPPGPVNPKPK